MHLVSINDIVNNSEIFLCAFNFELLYVQDSFKVRSLIYGLFVLIYFDLFCIQHFFLLSFMLFGL